VPELQALFENLQKITVTGGGQPEGQGETNEKGEEERGEREERSERSERRGRGGERDSDERLLSCLSKSCLKSAKMNKTSPI